MLPANRIVREWEEQQQKLQEQRTQKPRREVRCKVAETLLATNKTSPVLRISDGSKHHKYSESPIDAESSLLMQNERGWHHPSNFDTAVDVDDTCSTLFGNKVEDLPYDQEIEQSGIGRVGIDSDAHSNAGECKKERAGIDLSPRSGDDNQPGSQGSISTTRGDYGERDEAKTVGEGREIDSMCRRGVEGDGTRASVVFSDCRSRSFYDSLLDFSDTECSQDDRGQWRSAADRAASFETREGTDGYSKDVQDEKVTFISWMISRVGLLEKVSVVLQ